MLGINEEQTHCPAPVLQSLRPPWGRRHEDFEASLAHIIVCIEEEKISWIELAHAYNLSTRETEA